MRFPSRDLSDQFISSSYQDVLQQYMPADYLYVLDGYGNVVFGVPSASIGYTLITSDITSSMTVGSASVSTIINILQTTQSISSSWASESLVSTYANYAEYSGTSSLSVSASISDTASYFYGSGSGTIIGGLQFDTASAISSSQEGYVFWDNEAHTLALKPDISASTLQVGQETWVRVRVHEDIADGNAVYVSGSCPACGLPWAYNAIADGTRTKYQVIGLATENLAAFDQGFITIQGKVNDLDTSAFSEGSQLFLSETTTGSLREGPPDEPAEKVFVGYCLRSHTITGSLLVNPVSIPDTFRAFSGVIDLPSITDDGGGVVTIGTGSAALNELPNGKGITRIYSVQSASFSIPVGLTDVHYIIADYNNGSPIWSFWTGSSTSIDNIQKIKVYTITRAITNAVAWSSWDEPGVLLANKLMDRIVEAHGVERTEGMVIGESGSRYVTVTSGSYWMGVSKNTSADYNSTSSTLVLLYHSGSSNYTASQIYQYENSRYDDGTGLGALLPNKYVVNYLYKSATTQNRCLIMLSDTFGKLADAQASQPPPVPGDLLESGILVGRAIFESGNSNATQIDSAFVVQFTPSSILYHNDLSGLQGGTTDEYYHLTSASYVQVISGTSSYANTSSYSFFALSASLAALATSASYSLTSSFALNGGGGGGGTSLTTGSTYPITASWAQTASILIGSIESASYAFTASYALRVSGSGIDIPPYDYSYVTYTGPLNQVSTCSYYIGGGLPPTGSLVAQITCIYDSNLFIGVSKSLA